jgi:hypothetical protein
VALRAARAPKLRRALRDARKAGHACLVTDGTLIPIDPVAAGRPSCSGKHRRHGMNLQVTASPDGDIVRVPGPLPGAVHDLTAAQVRGIIRELAACGLVVPGDKGLPRRGHHPDALPGAGTSPPPTRDASRAHARHRAPGERASARLRSWRIVRKLRCCPRRGNRPRRSTSRQPRR